MTGQQGLTWSAIVQPAVSGARKPAPQIVSPVLPAPSVALHLPAAPVLPAPSTMVRSPGPVVVQPRPPASRNILARPTASLAELLRVAQATRLNAVEPGTNDSLAGSASSRPNADSNRATPPSVPTLPHAESNILELLHFAQSTRLGSPHRRSNRVAPLPPFVLTAALDTTEHKATL